MSVLPAIVPLVDDETFWNIIEDCRRETPDRDERLGWLRGRLSRMPELEIVQFQICLDRVLTPTFTWDMWAAADMILGWCSDDSFFYFRLWLVGLGREEFEKVALDPDLLAGTPQVRALAGRSPRAWGDHEWPEWEELDYVAGAAFEAVTGKPHEDFHDAHDAQDVEDPEPRHPVGDRWDVNRADEAARRFPNLNALFPAVERA